MTAPLKADQTAADRLLKAAVRRAIDHYRTAVAFGGEADRAVITPGVADMLANAATAADLLLSEPTS